MTVIVSDLKVNNAWSLAGSVMMTSSNGNIFRVTGPLCGGFHRSQRPETRSFYPSLSKRLSKQLIRRSFETPSRSLWRHCNVRYIFFAVSLAIDGFGVSLWIWWCHSRMADNVTSQISESHLTTLRMLTHWGRVRYASVKMAAISFRLSTHNISSDFCHNERHDNSINSATGLFAQHLLQASIKQNT